MADDTTPTGNSDPISKGLQPDDGIAVPRMSLKETGFSALRMSMQGRILEQANMQFRFPQMIRVVEEMMYNPAVSTGLGTINTLMCRSEIEVVPLADETPTDKARREFITSIFDDMDNSWQSTMQSIVTYIPYGHQVSEMVFRRRLNRNGSRWNDGLVGLSALKNRPQNSIARWNFDDSGRNLISISQSLKNMPNGFRFQSQMDEYGYIEIPREKLLIFRADPADDNPEGVSPLTRCYLAYKQLTMLTDHLMVGAARNLGGIPFAQLPPKYMDPNATPEDAAVYSAVQTIIGNLHAGQSSGIIFPKMLDEQGNELFDFQILEQKTGNVYNLESIIKLLQSNILYVLGCGSISMGALDGGSLSLQDSNTNILALTVAYRLSEIANTLNSSLIPTLFKLNGWSLERMPKVRFSDISNVSLEEQSKWLQRVMSVGGLEMDRGVFNKIRETGGFEPKPDDAPIDFDNLSTTLAGKASSSSQGMAVGVGGVNGGTSTSNKGGKDNSAQNADNSA